MEGTHVGEQERAAKPPWRILLIRSGHFGWVGLRSVLEALPHTRVVGEAVGLVAATEIVRENRPDAIFTAVETEGSLAVALVSQLHAASPESRVIAIDEGLGRDTLLAVGQTGADGFLAWDGMNPRVIELSLAAVLEAGLRVCSPAVAGELVGSEQRGRAHFSEPELSDHERAVLTRLAAGSTEKEIAAQESMSPTTVARVIIALKDKLHAPTLFVLGMRAATSGFSASQQ
jgi:DNA-binding NarL/FixJ family response regulator